MKTNISIELDDFQRNHLNNIYHNNKTKKLITRKDLVNLVNLMVKELLSEDVGNFRDITSNIAEEGFKYYFNDQRVTAEEYEGGIELWLEKQSKGENNEIK